MSASVPEETLEDAMEVLGSSQQPAQDAFDGSAISEFILSGDGNMFLVRRCTVTDNGEVHEYVHPLVDVETTSITH